MAEEIEIGFGIQRIHNLMTYINEIESFDIDNLSIAYGLEFNFNLDTNSVFFVIAVKISLKENDFTIIESKVLTEFIVENLKKYVEVDETLSIPTEAVETMFSISFTHTRAILSQTTNGSKFQKIILPIVNPRDLLKKIMEKANKELNK